MTERKLTDAERKNLLKEAREIFPKAKLKDMPVWEVTADDGTKGWGWSREDAWRDCNSRQVPVETTFAEATKAVLASQQEGGN